MKVIHRLNIYLETRGISAYAFERSCGVANGYLGKQLKVEGSVGSDILEKVGEEYPDLNLAWLITGKGAMLAKPVKSKQADKEQDMELREEQAAYAIRDKLIDVLKEQLEVLSTTGRKKRKSKK